MLSGKLRIAPGHRYSKGSCSYGNGDEIGRNGRKVGYIDDVGGVVALDVTEPPSQGPGPRYIPTYLTFAYIQLPRYLSLPRIMKAVNSWQ